MARLGGEFVYLQLPGGDPGTMLRATPGPLPGVRVINVATLCRPGDGLLVYDSAGALRWRAPHGVLGAAVDVSAGGTFVLHDGRDLDEWLRVEVTAASLPGGALSGRVRLEAARDTPLSGVTPAVGSGVQVWEITLRNWGSTNANNLAVWFEPELAESRWMAWWWAGSPWRTALCEADGLTTAFMGSAGGSCSITLRRTLPAGVVACPWREVRMRVSWDDTEGGRAHLLLAGVYGVSDTPVYRIYHAEGRDPVVGQDTPLAESATLPVTPPDVFGDGDQRFTVTRVSQYGVESTPGRIARIVISGGVQQSEPPTGPYNVQLESLSLGQVRVTSLALLPPVGAARRPDGWALWYSTNGTPPGGAGAPDATAVMAASGLWRYDGLPLLGDGTVLHVLAKTSRDGTYSEAERRATLTIDLAGPAAPDGLEAFE